MQLPYKWIIQLEIFRVIVKEVLLKIFISPFLSRAAEMGLG